MVEVNYIKGDMSEIASQSLAMTRTLPEKWGEMTDEQYLVFCEEVCREQSEAECRLRILKRWMGLSDREFLQPKVGIASQSLAMTKMAEQYFEKLFPVIDFLFAVPGEIASAEPRNDGKPKVDPAMFTRNFIHDFEIRLDKWWHPIKAVRNYVGPSDKLLNLTGDEIEKSEFCYSVYHQTKKREDLVRLVAVLYRERDFSTNEHSVDYDGDVRVPFESARVDIIAARISSLPDFVLHGIRIWYERCMMHWAQRHPRVFKKSTNDESRVTNDPQAWRKLIRAMATPKRGTVDDVRRMKMGDLMFELDCLEQEREEYDAMVAKMNAK